MERFVYFFGNGKADGHGAMKDVLGGKGAGLAEMTKREPPRVSSYFNRSVALELSGA